MSTKGKLVSSVSASRNPLSSIVNSMGVVMNSTENSSALPLSPADDFALPLAACRRSFFDRDNRSTRVAFEYPPLTVASANWFSAVSDWSSCNCLAIP